MSKTTIGITGGIGSGKSIVARLLRCNGFPVYDCDTEAKRLMVENSYVKSSLIRKLGSEIYHENGEINKTKLSNEIFSSIVIREIVNETVHAAVLKDILKKRETTNGFLFIESAILGTGGLSDFCNSIWIVFSPEEERIRRIIKRDNLPIEDILKRIKSQEDELSKLKDNQLIWIDNDDKHPLLAKILRLTNKFVENQKYRLLC